MFKVRKLKAKNNGPHMKNYRVLTEQRYGMHFCFAYHILLMAITFDHFTYVYNDFPVVCTFEYILYLLSTNKQCVMINKDYRWSSQRACFTRLSRYGENVKSNWFHMINSYLFIAIVSMEKLLISFTTARVPLLSSNFFHYTVKEIIRQ